MGPQLTGGPELPGPRTGGKSAVKPRFHEGNSLVGPRAETFNVSPVHVDLKRVVQVDVRRFVDDEAVDFLVDALAAFGVRGGASVGEQLVHGFVVVLTDVDYFPGLVWGGEEVVRVVFYVPG